MFKNKKLISILVILSLILTSISFGFASQIDEEEKQENINREQEQEDLLFGMVREDTYRAFMESYGDKKRPKDEYIIQGSNFIDASNDGIIEHESFENEIDVLEIATDNATITYEVNIEESGLYNMNINFYTNEYVSSTIEIGVMVDGEYQYDEADKFVFHKMWENITDIYQDANGNDINPRKRQIEMWQDESFSDSTGFYDDSMLFYLEAGKREITINVERGFFFINKIKIYNEEPLISYKEYAQKHSDLSPASIEYVNKHQGEKFLMVSDSSIIAKYDRSSPATEPSHPSKIRLNTIGEYSWQYHGQKIIWEIEVPEDGFYKIAIKARQHLLTGLFVSRRIEINGEVPFEELKNYRFDFHPKWQMIELRNEDEIFEFYLEKGKNTISMEVVAGDLAQVTRELQEVVYTLNYLYRKILMITGPNPDTLRDYYLHKEIPELMEGIEISRNSLYKQIESIEKIADSSGGETSIAETLAVQLDDFLDDPNSIPVRLETFRSNVSALSGWMLRLKEQPLEIDYLVVSTPDQEKINPRAGFFENIFFSIRAFLGSFTEDYQVLGETYEGEEVLDVWVAGLGRDQVQIVRSLVDDYFEPDYGTKVNVNLVQMGLIQATLAGKGPDIALFVPNTDPVNLAARGALYDISQFDDFNEVRNRFQRTALDAYEFEDGYYALPTTQGFQMMFYRKDIFQDLGIEPPDTWEDFYELIPIIQRNNMEIGLPVIAVQPGQASLANNTIFQVLLHQKGGKYYDEDRKKTMFDTNEALEAFREWTGFYTRYSFPMEYEFYSRFRTGEMPLAIETYARYNQLVVAAPELNNLWDMVPIPGTKREDGTIDRTSVGAGMASIMFDKVKNKEDAWEFLKWWTSADIQGRFGREIEALMGPAARYETANVEAMQLLPWKQEQLNLLYEQWENVVEIPQVPATYYVFRNVYNAFRKVAFHNENPRETLFFYNRDMNREITRKRIEFGLEVEEEDLN